MVSDRAGGAHAQKRFGGGRGCGPGRQKKAIEAAYTLGEGLGIQVWCEDEAGPYQTVPYAGASWQPTACPRQQPHEYIRNGTAKLLTLFHPASGQVRVKGVTSTTNAVIHTWLQDQLTDILCALPPVTDPPPVDPANWERWRADVRTKTTLPSVLPPLRLLLVLDNLVGHHTPAWLCWCFAHGILPIFTPLGGSWLNMAESIQRLLKRRALDGQSYASPQAIIHALEAVAAHWNQHPTPFIGSGQRRERRRTATLPTYSLPASGASAARSVRAFYATLRPT